MNQVSQTISGVAAISDWLGDGGQPVAQMVAEFRAQRCLSGNDGKPCPLNVEPHWWNRVKHEIADWIRKEMEIKNGMKLHVEGEEKLGICKLCGCALPLKIFAPAHHIKNHISNETLQSAPPWCWMKRELSVNKSS